MLISEHYTLTAEDAYAAHELALSFGGRDGMLNEHLIQSAIARPYTGYYPTIWQKAAALVESMAKNHGFVDGNKRTTLFLLRALVNRSGYEIVSPRNEIADIILAVASGCVSFDQLSDWFKPRIKPLALE